jgi:hypothetical protein
MRAQGERHVGFMRARFDFYLFIYFKCFKLFYFIYFYLLLNYSFKIIIKFKF